MTRKATKREVDDNTQMIRVKALSKRFGHIRAVDDLDLTVLKNDIYGLLGPNGSGKSTTIRMILSLVSPDTGSVHIFGQPLNKKRNKILAGIGALVEKPDFYEHLSAWKNLEIMAGYSKYRATPERINDTLELVGLKQRASSKVKTFSKGMKQRLGIAQALLHDPELIVLDEPSSGLDPSGTREVRELILRLNREMGKTIVLSSHQLREVELIANRMAIINLGKKVVEGDVKEILDTQEFNTLIETTDNRKAYELLKNGPLALAKVTLKNERLQIQSPREMIPEIVSLLVENGIGLISVMQDHSLENYFLNVT